MQKEILLDKMNYKIYTFILCLFATFHGINSHGRMNEPPARNVMWRYGFSVPADYNDLGLNCGGVGQQHQKNGIIQFELKKM